MSNSKMYIMEMKNSSESEEAIFKEIIVEKIWELI